MFRTVWATCPRLIIRALARSRYGVHSLSESHSWRHEPEREITGEQQKADIIAARRLLEQIRDEVLGG